MRRSSINRVELQGRVGTVRIQMMDDQVVSNFSLMTEYVYKLRDGAMVCETTHHNVVAFEGGEVKTLGLTRGSLVHLTGRIRMSRYTATDGSERVFTEIRADSLKVVE